MAVRMKSRPSTASDAMTTVRVVAPDVYAALHLAPERSGVDADEQHSHHPAAEDTHGAEDRRQQGHHDDTRPETRRQDPLHGIDGHHFHRAQLLAGLHEADFRGE